MGNKCSSIHNSPMPDPYSPNKNRCTEYEKNADGTPQYDPSDPTKNAILNGDPNNQYSSAYIIPEELCYPIDRSHIGSKNQEKKLGDYCSQIADGDEWTYAADKTSGAFGHVTSPSNSVGSGDLSGIDYRCNYNDCNQEQALDFKAGCCNGCCAIEFGTKVACQRQKFSAENVVCCFLDNECEEDNGNIDSCWQTREKRKTCDPNYRNLKSSNCLEAIKPYCTGDKLFAGQSHWMEAWLPNTYVDVNSGIETATEELTGGLNERKMVQPCLRALARAVYNDSGSVCTWEQLEKLDLLQGVVDPEGLAWAQDVLESIMAKYIKEFGSPFASINQDGYMMSTDFMNFYWSLCKKFPALCQGSLKDFCSGFSPDILIDKPEAFKWCGCFLPDKFYDEYEKLGINKECSPYCNIQGNIPLIDQDFTQKICVQTTCIIDDVTIKIANSIYPGGINFSQVCRSCGQSQINKIYEGIDYNHSSNETKQSSLGFYTTDPNNLFSQEFDYKGTATSGDPYSEYSSNFWYSKQRSNVTGDLKVALSQPSLPLDTYIDTIVTLNYSQIVYNDQGVSKIKFYITGVKNIIKNNFSGEEGEIPIKIFYYLDNDNKKVYFNTDKSALYSGDMININISQNEKQQIDNSVRQDNININVNTCSCIIRDSTIDISNASIEHLNIAQNCGGSQCYNSKGETIPCGSNSINTNTIDNIEDSINKFKQELFHDKLVISVEVMLGVVLLLAFIWWSVRFKTQR